MRSGGLLMPYDRLNQSHRFRVRASLYHEGTQRMHDFVVERQPPQDLPVRLLRRVQFPALV